MTDGKTADLCAKISRKHGEAVALGSDALDPEYKKRDAIWRTIRRDIRALTETPAETLTGCQAKLRLCQLIPDDDLTASTYSDILAL